MKKQIEKNVIYTEVSATKSFSRVFIKVMVTLLLVAFVLSIGGIWNRGGEFPIVLKTNHFIIDLSPRSIYQLEYNRQESAIKEQRIGLFDPRQYKHRLNNKVRLSLEDQIVRQELYRAIGLPVSSNQRAYLRKQTGITDPMAQRFILTDQSAFGPLGVFSLLSQLGTSDVYMYNDLANFVLSAEFFILEKDRFLFSQISAEEKQNYYLRHLEEYADSITLTDLEIGDISQAKKLLQVLYENVNNQGGLSDSSESLWAEFVQKKTRVHLIPNANNYDLFRDAINAYKSKNQDQDFVFIPKPVYENGIYHVILVESVNSFDQLSEEKKRSMLSSYILNHKKVLLKQSHKKWIEVREQFVRLSDSSFDSAEKSILGTFYFKSRPFTFLDRHIVTERGSVSNLPIFRNVSILNALLETGIGEQSHIIEINDEIFLYVRPLERKITNSNTDILNNEIIQQNTARFKETMTIYSMSRPYFRERYGLLIMDNSKWEEQ